MRKFSPACLAASVALAFMASTAFAQSLGVRPVTTTGTGGSTVTATTTNSGATAGTGAAVFTGNATPPSETTPASAGGTVTSSGSNSAAATTGPATSTQTNSGREIVTTGDAALGNRITPNNATAAQTGAALGRSEGQTSSGTAGATSTLGVVPGIDAALSAGVAVPGGTGTDGTGTGGTVGGGFASGVVVPGSALVGGVGADGTVGGGITANGERFGATATTGSVANANAAAATPIFNATAAQGAARIAQRRARGEEPRIFGIAPRTDRDLTHQMPDDPIIRY